MMARTTSTTGLYFFEPDLFKEGKAFYENRDYESARGKFAACREAFKRTDDLAGNYSTLAGFYELECCRRLEDLEGLAQLLNDYVPAQLSREIHKNQVDLYSIWDAVRTKSWPRLVGLTGQLLEEKKWTSSQLAQIFYCRGLALDGIGRKTDALIAFNGAFTADFTASEELTRKAVLDCLRIYREDEEVKLAIELHGTADEDKNSNGYFLLQEAVALVDLWDKALGGGEELPADYRTFLKYKPAQQG